MRAPAKPVPAAGLVPAPHRLGGGACSHDCRSVPHMTIVLLLLGVALFGAMAGYVIFCDRV
jgi:hypothetical protein